MQELNIDQAEQVCGGVPPAVAIVAVAVVRSSAFRTGVAAVAGAIGTGVGSAVVEWFSTDSK